eukprot:m.214592 g.214592  ORF g.214592 m.214592 type:complete len:1141 (-) comp10769_c0_seq1:327-3749(-)
MDRAGVALAQALGKNTTLQKMSIANNQITDKAIFAFVTALKGNHRSTLELLDIDGNRNLSDAAVNQLKELISVSCTNDAAVFVLLLGYGGVGKTTLCGGMRSSVLRFYQRAFFKPSQGMTIGLEEHSLDFAETPIVIQDCGGQHLYHHMHGILVGQPRSVHVVVLNPLEDKDFPGSCEVQALYWFRLLAAKCNKPRVLLVFSHSDLLKANAFEIRARNICRQVEEELRAHFTGVVEIAGVFNENCKRPSNELLQAVGDLAKATERTVEITTRATLDFSTIKQQFCAHQRYELIMTVGDARELLTSIEGNASLEIMIAAGELMLLGELANSSEARICGDRAKLMSRLLDSLCSNVASHAGSEAANRRFGGAWLSDDHALFVIGQFPGLTHLSSPAIAHVLRETGLGFACTVGGNPGLLLLPMLETRLVDHLPTPLWPEKCSATSLRIWRAYVVRDRHHMLPARFGCALFVALHEALVDPELEKLGTCWAIQPHGDGAVLTAPEKDLRMYVHIPGALVEAIRRDTQTRRVVREQHRDVPRLERIEVFCRGSSLDVAAAMLVLEGCLEQVRRAECANVQFDIKTLPAGDNWPTEIDDKNKDKSWPALSVRELRAADPSVREQLADQMPISPAESMATAELNAGGNITVWIECRTADGQVRALVSDRSLLFVAGIALKSCYGFDPVKPFTFDKTTRQHVFELKPRLAEARQYLLVCLCLSPTATTLNETIIGSAPLLFDLSNASRPLKATELIDDKDVTNELVATAKASLKAAIEQARHEKLHKAARAAVSDAQALWAAALSLSAVEPAHADAGAAVQKPVAAKLDDSKCRAFGFESAAGAQRCIDGLLLARLAYEVRGEENVSGVYLSNTGDRLLLGHTWASEPTMEITVQPHFKALRVKTSFASRWYSNVSSEDWHTCRVVLLVRRASDGKTQVCVGIRGTDCLGDIVADVTLRERFYRSASTHHGFKEYGEAALHALKKLCSKVGIDLKNEKVSVLIGGHSLGGAAAIVLHRLLLLEGDVTADRLHTATFAAPIPFSKHVVQEFDKTHKAGVSQLFNFVHRHDVVPMVPPRRTRVGRFFYFDRESTSSDWYFKFVMEPLKEKGESRALVPLLLRLRGRFHKLDTTYKAHFERLLSMCMSSS